MTCATCGAEIADDARFCPKCGAPTPAGGPLGTEERKIVTVLFADLVDSTGLAARLDPERAREVMGAFFETTSAELAALRGQAEKFIGDAVMAVFGLPTVSEDDALRAVRAGLAIRDRIRRLGRSLGLPFPLEVHVGIESGDVATGASPAEQLLVTGPAVNVAARLQVAAAPGEVLVGETAYALTQRMVSFGEPRPIEARGFERGLTAYPVEHLTLRSARRTIPLVGRRSELTLLREALGLAASASRPCLFTLLGEPGIGKSRLVDELVAGLDPSVVAVVGRVEPFGGRGTFAPLAGMIRELAGIDADTPRDEARRRLDEIVAGCCDPTEAERVAARLALAIGYEEEGHDESAFVQEVQSGFLALIDGLAQRQPVMLAFDDLHSARPPLLDLVERLASRAAHHRGQLLAVAVARPELAARRSGWGGGAANHVKIRLEALSPHEAADLARAAGGEGITDPVARRIAARTGGNPFFIVETTGMLMRQDAAGAPAAGRPLQQSVPLPPTVQALLAARLDHLEPRLRDLARRASVFIYSFDLGELAMVAEPDATALRELEDEEVLVLEGRPPKWRFRNGTLRDVAYAGLPKRERQRLHALVAEALGPSDPKMAAMHLEHAALAALDLNPADRTLPDRAVEALKEVADRARGRMENADAIDLYERALALAGPTATWGVREARILAGVGEARYWRGEYGPASEALARAEELGSALGDAWTLAHALRFRGDITMNVGGDIDEAQAYLDRSLEAAEELGDPRTIARTLLFAGWVPWERRDLGTAEEMWTRALALARENRDRWAETRALTSLSSIRTDTERYDEADELIRQALAVAEDLGDQFSVAVATVQLARLSRLRGDPEQAVAHLDRAVAILDDLRARWELADALGERGDAYRRLGRLDEAEADLQASLRISEELGERQLLGWTWRQLAKVALRRGDREEAEVRLRRADEEDLRRPQ